MAHVNQDRTSSRPAVDVQVADRFARQVDTEDVGAAAVAALLSEGETEGRMTVAVIADEQVRELNARYRDVNNVTDVLAFSARPALGHFVEPDEAVGYLGDVIIAYPQAEAQAKAAGHPVADELRLLVVHGTLHLLDYDHGTADEEAAMWKRQDEILAELAPAGHAIRAQGGMLSAVSPRSRWRGGLPTSFRHAFEGLLCFVRNQRNARIQLMIGLLAVFLAAVLRLTAVEWALLALTIGLVLVSEMFNSVTEAAVDAVTQEYHPLAKAAKDVAAGAVVFSAIVSVVVGLLLFGPRLWTLAKSLR
jgi:rRNA maturation RNase YbeY